MVEVRIFIELSQPATMASIEPSTMRASMTLIRRIFLDENHVFSWSFVIVGWRRTDSPGQSAKYPFEPFKTWPILKVLSETYGELFAKNKKGGLTSHATSAPLSSPAPCAPSRPWCPPYHARLGPGFASSLGRAPRAARPYALRSCDSSRASSRRRETR